MTWDLLWTTLDTWMPNLMAFIKMIPTIVSTLLNFEYKNFLISCGYIYYYTIFFWTLRILIYSGITLINLINIKHTTFYKKNTLRTQGITLLKFHNVSSFKKSLLQVAAIIYL